MHRIDHASATDTLPVPQATGAPGFFRRPIAAQNQIGTRVTADWANAVQEELVSLIAATGMPLDKTSQSQALRSLRRLFAGNVTTITANTALTLDMCGVILVSAAGGSVTLTLPAANAANFSAFTIVRTDNSANAVTIARAGSDTIQGATSLALSSQYASVVLEVDGAAVWVIVGGSALSPAGAPLAQCRLTKSGANLLLAAFGGNRISIGGAAQTIPSAGVTLAPTSLAVGTTYYIYAFMAGSTMTLEASATGWSVDVNTGMPIKSGDATRTLVGMARTITGPAWQDTPAQRFTVSYWNRRTIAAFNAFSASRSTSSSTYVELSPSERLELLSWSDDAATFGVSGRVENATAGTSSITSFGLDGAAPQPVFTSGSHNNPAASAVSVGLTYSLQLTEGYHYATIIGTCGAGAATWITGTSITATVRG